MENVSVPRKEKAVPKALDSFPTPAEDACKQCSITPCNNRDDKDIIIEYCSKRKPRHSYKPKALKKK